MRKNKFILVLIVFILPAAIYADCGGNCFPGPEYTTDCSTCPGGQYTYTFSIRPSIDLCNMNIAAQWSSNADCEWRWSYSNLDGSGYTPASTYSSIPNFTTGQYTEPVPCEQCSEYGGDWTIATTNNCWCQGAAAGSLAIYSYSSSGYVFSSEGEDCDGNYSGICSMSFNTAASFSHCRK